MARVHPDAAVREAGTRVEEQLSKWGVVIAFRSDLYEAFRALSEQSPEAPSEQLRLLEFWMRDFRRAGHAAPLVAPVAW